LSGSYAIAIYALEFIQLAYNISWDEITFINEFQFGSGNDAKDLLFTLLNPSTLS
jgi:hypothetical protein